jgi:signal transduction histidine kinase
VNALLRRFAHVDLQRLDYLVAAVLIADLVLEALLENAIPDRLATALVGTAVGAIVAVRRRWPAAALVACSAVVLLQTAFRGQLFNLDSQSVLFPFMLCAYGAGAWLPWGRGLAAVALAAGLLCAEQLIEIYVTHTGGGVVSSILFSLLAPGLPWLVGAFIAERRQRAKAFTTLAVQAEAEGAERERAAIAQERVIIGRELQDIIAHSVSMMVVQAGGARRLLATQPDRARESILNVEHTGRETLAEMRRLLGLLRKDDDPRALSPQPGLDQLDQLVDELGREGMTCEFSIDGDRIDLTPGVDLVGYRALEGALRSAAEGGCTNASMLVQYAPGWLKLDVRADRPVANLATRLAPIHERIDLYGGRVTVEANGRFAVHCELPLQAGGSR